MNTPAATAPARPRCDGCGNEIDPDTCGCGESIGDGFEHDNHSPIPMGCDCYRDTPSATAPAATRAAVPPPYTVNGFGGAFEVIARTTGGVAISALAALDRNDIETARFIVEAANTHSQLLAQNAAMRAAIDSALEYFEDREDVVDGPYGEPEPNKEMALAQELRAAVGEKA